MLFTPEQETASAAVPWQPFRADRTFWLIGLALLLGAIALARPAVAVPAAVSDHTIIVVDTSASMGAVTEDGRSRLDVARSRAAELIGLADDGRVVSLVQAGAHARVLADAVPAGQAAPALDRLALSGGRAAMDEALTLAAALIRPGEGTAIQVLADRLPDDATAFAPAGTRVDIVGDTQPNLGIGAIRGSRLSAGGATVLVEVDSFSALAVEARVSIEVGEEVVARERVDVPPNGRVDVELALDGEVPDDGLVVARVRLVGQGPDGEPLVDGLVSDDQAQMVLPEEPALQVLHVGPDNVFLDAALRALPDVVVTRLPRMPPQVDADVIVLDRLPLPAQPAAPVLAIAPTSLPDGLAVAGTRDLPSVTQVDVASPLLLDADLRTLAVARTDVVEAPALRTVLGGPGGPLLLEGRQGEVGLVLLPFALTDSNLPLQAAFPVLVANSLTHLAGRPADLPLIAGADRTLPLPAGVPATLTAPDGEAIRIGGLHVTATLDQPGVWQVDYDTPPPGRSPTRLAVNADVAESDLRVGAPGTTGGGRPADGQPSTQGGTPGDLGGTAPRLALPGDVALDTEGVAELWRWFLAAAALLVAAEVALSLRDDLVGGRRT